MTGSGFCENVVILTTFSYSMFAAERCAHRQLGRFILLAQKKLLSFWAEISAAKLIFADPCKRFVLVRKLDFFHFKLDKAVLFQDAVAGVPMVSLNLPPAPLRKGNIQALDLHHSIGLSATPSSL
ncbi:hypothetical protein P0G09_01595 [Faecalibacterium sp. DFI.5.82]|nr:hypothetical protein [Faecalibacterium sp. DFI.5.82]